MEYGIEQRVIPASPISLIALLGASPDGRGRGRVRRNAEEISPLGTELHH